MSQLAELLKNPPSESRRCAIGQAIDHHPDGKAIATAIDNTAWSHTALSRLLREHKIAAGEKLVRGHRRGECRCGPKP